MQRGSLLKTCAMCVIASVACSLGCAHTMSSESTRIRQASWHADLDDYQEVRLSISRIHSRDDGAPARTFEQLTLEVRPRPHLQFESILKSVEFTPGVRRGQLGFDEIEVRADESRSRVWFVDRATGLIVATLDRDTGATTGPDDEPPSWAAVDGGILLEGGD